MTQQTNFPGQQCQDPGINERFRALHQKLVNQVIAFCVENNITIDEFNLNVDNLAYSIGFGSWHPCTDSALVFDKMSEEYKEVLSGKKRITKEEFAKIKAGQEPFLYSV